MENLNEFVKEYYENNMQFNNSKFLNLLNELIVKLNNTQQKNSKIPIILEEMLVKYRKGDFYYLIEIIEYELILNIKKEV